MYGIAAAVLAAGFIFDESTCLWRALTGWPCPGCGMGHALIALAQGQFGAAWNYHPASVVVVPILLWTAIHKIKRAF